MTANDSKTTAMVPEDTTPRFKGIKSATGLELRTRFSRVRPDDISGPNSKGSPDIDGVDFEQRITSFTKGAYSPANLMWY